MNSRIWNKWNSEQRYNWLRKIYPDCWATNKLSLQKWSEISTATTDLWLHLEA